MVGVDGIEPSVSYTPTAYKAAALTGELHPHINLAGPQGFEPWPYAFGERYATITPETYRTPKASSKSSVR